MSGPTRSTMAALAGELYHLHPVEGPPDLGRPCEAWGCPRRDADDTHRCPYHNGTDTVRRARPTTRTGDSTR